MSIWFGGSNPLASSGSGWRTVNTITDRDNIPLSEREEGMVVHVIGVGNFQLIGGIGNGNWVSFPSITFPPFPSNNFSVNPLTTSTIFTNSSPVRLCTYSIILIESATNKYQGMKLIAVNKHTSVEVNQYAVTGDYLDFEITSIKNVPNGIQIRLKNNSGNVLTGKIIEENSA